MFSKLIRLVVTSCVYSLWQERNRRIFQNAKLSENLVIDYVVDSVRNRIFSLGSCNLNESILKNWNLSVD